MTLKAFSCFILTYNQRMEMRFERKVKDKCPSHNYRSIDLDRILNKHYLDFDQLLSTEVNVIRISLQKEEFLCLFFFVES